MMYNGQCYTSFPAPPQGLPTLDMPKVKKLTQGETDECLKRLTYRRERKVSLQPLTTPRKMKKEEMQAANERLYNVEMRRREVRQKKVSDMLSTRDSVKSLDTSSLMESVERLYKQGQVHQKELSQRLESKYNSKAAARPISSEEVTALNERFYGSRKGAQRENLDRLVQKYVFDVATPRKVLTKEQQEATVTRLSARS